MEPGRIVVAGDWHGNTGWALGVVRRLSGLLGDEPERLIVHVGDFGVWSQPGGVKYLRKLDRALKEADAMLWFVDGNHEDHELLGRYPVDGGMGLVTERIRHLRRGHRWEWHGRTWLALGGAVSLDRVLRVEGRSWWAGEEIGETEAAAAAAAGPADVMVTHDVPQGVEHEFPPLPPALSPLDLERSDRHRARLRGVVDAVRPGHLIHGHLHRSYQWNVDFGWGTTEVTGLDRDNAPGGNWRVLDVAAMEWGTVHEPPAQRPRTAPPFNPTI